MLSHGAEQRLSFIVNNPLSDLTGCACLLLGYGQQLQGTFRNLVSCHLDDSYNTGKCIVD
jgi:hypothetical protein